MVSAVSECVSTRSSSSPTVVAAATEANSGVIRRPDCTGRVAQQGRGHPSLLGSQAPQHPGHHGGGKLVECLGAVVGIEIGQQLRQLRVVTKSVGENASRPRLEPVERRDLGTDLAEVAARRTSRQIHTASPRCRADAGQYQRVVVRRGVSRPAQHRWDRRRTAQPCRSDTGPGLR